MTFLKTYIEMLAGIFWRAFCELSLLSFVLLCDFSLSYLGFEGLDGLGCSYMVF